jgi:hypothetical protein
MRPFEGNLITDGVFDFGTAYIDSALLNIYDSATFRHHAEQLVTKNQAIYTSVTQVVQHLPYRFIVVAFSHEDFPNPSIRGQLWRP